MYTFFSKMRKNYIIKMVLEINQFSYKRINIACVYVLLSLK